MLANPDQTAPVKSDLGILCLLMYPVQRFGIKIMVLLKFCC